MATDQMQILPTKPYDLIMNWRALGLNCASCGGTGRVKFLKDGQPFCQYCDQHPTSASCPKGLYR
jgi:hypothetical protein